MKKNGKKPYIKSYSFANASVRKYYPGTYSLTLIVNGTERGTLNLEVLDAK